MTWQHYSMHGRMVDTEEPQEKETSYSRMNQGSDFLGGSLSNIDHVIARIQFRRES